MSELVQIILTLSVSFGIVILIELTREESIYPHDMPLYDENQKES